MLSSILPQFNLVQTLGHGGEGIVHLVQSRQTGEKRIWKQYHRPIVGSSGAGLRLYAERVKPNQVGLPPITLVGTEQAISGLHYPYEPLHEVHWRVLRGSKRVAQAMLGAHCQMQHYLMTHGGIGITDTAAHHLLLAENGRFHFIDFGFAIKPITHERYLKDGRFAYGFIMLLLDIFHKNIKDEFSPRQGYAYDRPCLYCQSQQLDQIAARHPWVQRLLTELCSQPASIFIDPDFYADLSHRFSPQIVYPHYVTRLGNTLRTLKRWQQNWNGRF